MLEKIGIFFVGLVIGVIVIAVWPRQPKVVERPVVVGLSRAALDSMELSIRAKLQAELKPVVIVKKDLVQKRRADSLMAMILSARDTLEYLRTENAVWASLTLEYYNDRFGKYEDTIDIKADFISRNISPVFSPRQREYRTTVVDTLRLPPPEGSIWLRWLERLGIFTAGALTAKALSK